VELRAFMRRGWQNRFCAVVYEGDTHNGVWELLEILGNVISGFGVPLKDEHKVFMCRALIPLHKVKALPSFHRQLSECLNQFLQKDAKLAGVVITALLRWWPVSMSSKQVVFLNQLESAVEAVREPELQRVKAPIFRRLAVCIASPQYHVSERALTFWNNANIVESMRSSSSELLPELLPALHKSKQHWHPSIYPIAFNVLEMLRSFDPALYEELSRKQRSNRKAEEAKAGERARRWANLSQLDEQKRQEDEARGGTPKLSPRSSEQLAAQVRAQMASQNRRTGATTNSPMAQAAPPSSFSV
jgi:serine/threonine-protein phosphatase 2A regulatory subunit B'